MNIGDNHIRQ